MTDLQPYAIFLGGSFLVGFVARTLIGGYRTIAGKPKTIEIEMVEAEVVPDIRDADKKLPGPVRLKENDFIDLKESYDAVRPLEARWKINDDDIPWIPVRPTDTNVGSGSALNPRNVAADQLWKIGADHDRTEINNRSSAICHQAKPDVKKLRGSSQAARCEIRQTHCEGHRTLEPYNVVIRGTDKNPQLLCVPESVHKKIVESFAADNYDCADLVEGCDFVMNRYDLPRSPDSYDVKIEKGTKCHAGSPDEVKDWLRKTVDLNAYFNWFSPEYKQPATSNSPNYPSKKLVSFNLDEEAYDNLVSNARDNNVTPSAYLNDLLRKQTVADEAENRQRHFSNGEKVRLMDPQKVYDKLSEPTYLSWICDKNHKLLTHKDRWPNNMRPEVGDCGEIVGFVMATKDGNTVPYHNGVAVVKLHKVAHNANMFVAVSFDGLESLENNESDDQKTIKVGDWVHWKTQAGHTSVRPSVVFKTRKSKGVNEVQLCYVQKSKVVRFWCPISKCYKLISPPAAFNKILAHQLPEAVLAEKLRSI